MEQYNGMPVPRFLSVTLLTVTGFTGWINSLTHDQVTFCMSITLGLCGLVSYGYRFLRWLISVGISRRTLVISAVIIIAFLFACGIYVSNGQTITRKQVRAAKKEWLRTKRSLSQCVLMDSTWYALSMQVQIDSLDWRILQRLKHKRLLK